MKLIYCRDALCISISNEPYVFPDKERHGQIISIRNLSIIISAFMKKDINRERILDLLVLQVVNA